MNAVLKPQANELLQEALKYELNLRRLLWHYTRNNDDVDELLQEVYARLLKPCEPVKCVEAYAVFVARNVAVDWLRHQMVVPIELLADVSKLERLDEGALLETIISDQEELELILWAVNRLRPSVRRVFLLRKIYGYSQKEIAHRLGVTEDTVESHMTRAARELALILGSRLP